MTLGDIILNYRNSFNPKMSQRDFAKKCGLSHTYIAALEKNIDPRTNKPIAPTLDTVKYISKGIGITIEEILKMLDDEQEFKMNEEAPKFDNITGVDKKITNSATVFVYGTIPAGTPIELIEDILDTEEIDADMLRGNKQYFGLRVNGHSMEPDYLDGDTLILLKQDDCESGDDAVVMVNGYDGTFKRIIKDPDKKTIRLQPLNTQLDENGLPLYEPITYTEEQIERLPVRIIGVVEEIRRKKRRKK